MRAAVERGKADIIAKRITGLTVVLVTAGLAKRFGNNLRCGNLVLVSGTPDCLSPYDQNIYNIQRSDHEEIQSSAAAGLHS